MLNSERTFERSHSAVFKFCLRQQLFPLKELNIEMRLFNIFKNTKVMKLTKVILENSFRVLQVTSKWKTLKQLVYFLKTFGVLLTFKLTYILTKFWEMLQNHTFWKAHRRLTKQANININRVTQYEIMAL